MSTSVNFQHYREAALSSHDQVARALGADIISGTYPPGTKIPHETDILERFGISRTVLREVLKTLTAKGLIVSKTRVGTKVLESSHWNMFDADVLSWKVAGGFDENFRTDLMEIRRALEPRAAALAAARQNPTAIAELRSCIAAMREATDTRRAFAEVDLKFHQTIGLASGNALMSSISAVIETALVASFTMSSPIDDPQDHANSVRAHEKIVDAIEVGDGAAAAEAMRLVIDHGAQRIANSMEQESN